VIATILMVAITVVLAAVLYVMVTRIIDVDGGDPKPSVILGNLSCDAGACEARVTTAKPATDLGAFRVTVSANGATVIPPTTLAADANVTGGGLTFRYRDIGGEGSMTAGDSFRLGGVADGVTYEVSFLWRDGDVISSIVMPS